MDEVDNRRRRFLIRALSYGLFTTSAAGLSIPAWSMGQIPRELPPGKSIYRLNGDVRVDDRPANIDTRISASSIIETGKQSQLVFAVGRDAFILRSNSRVELQGNNAVLTSLRLITGKILSVFGARKPSQPMGLKTTVATIGIRGTGAYLEADPEQTYICTCYGKADLASIADPASRETVTTRHHDSPRYILASAPVGQAIKSAPVINHTDEELELIESIVGRSVPFAFSGDYDTLRKNKY